MNKSKAPQAKENTAIEILLDNLEHWEKLKPEVQHEIILEVLKNMRSLKIGWNKNKIEEESKDG